MTRKHRARKLSSPTSPRFSGSSAESRRLLMYHQQATTDAAHVGQVRAIHRSQPTKHPGDHSIRGLAHRNNLSNSPSAHVHFNPNVSRAIPSQTQHSRDSPNNSFAHHGQSLKDQIFTRDGSINDNNTDMPSSKQAPEGNNVAISTAALRLFDAVKHSVKIATDTANDHLSDIKIKARHSVHEMALTNVDTLEDEQFSWSHLLSNLERLFVIVEALPDFVLFIYSILMWEQPLKTSFFFSVYIHAVLSSYLPVLLAAVFCANLVFYFLTQESVLAGMGLQCLFIDAQAEPLFADHSRSQHLQDRHDRNATLHKLADPDKSPLHMKNLPSTLGSAANAATRGIGRPTELWNSVKDRLLAVAQLQTRDLADTLEKGYNFITWKRPFATAIALLQVAVAAAFASQLPASWFPKIAGLGVGFLLFVILPLQLKFPRYRRLFSPTHLILNPFPTHAEWAIEQLARVTYPKTFPIHNSNTSSHKNTKAGISDDTNTGVPEVTSRTDTFPCVWNGHAGSLTIGSSLLEFLARSGKYMRVDMSQIVRIRKLSDSSIMGLVKNMQLELLLHDGRTVKFDKVEKRDEAFSMLAAASSDPDRHWRVPGT